MNDYISREAAIAAAFAANAIGNSEYRNVYDTVERIRMIPAAGVVDRKRGKWIIEKRYEVETYTDYRCPECGALFVDEPQILSEFSEMRFCPACGCDLRGDFDV